MKIAAALVFTGTLFVAGCHRTPDAKPIAETAGPTHPDVDKTLAIDRMLVAHQCSNCHAADYLRVGPPVLAIRDAFANASAVDVERLKQSILKGSSGKWGEAIMPAQTQVSPEQAGEIVAIILGKVPAR